MQDIMPAVGADAQLIQSYGASGFRIGNVFYSAPVLVSPTATFMWNGEYTINAFAPLLNLPLKTEVLLIGTGARHVMVSAAVKAELKRHGLSLDTMDTGAACRTFNILLGEGRRVASALQLAG